MTIRPDSSATATAADLRGKRFALVPVTPEYHRAIYALSISQQVAFRWRFHGLVPTFEAFERNLHSNVLVQFVVTPATDPSKVVGLVVAYNVNLQDGYVYIAVVHTPQVGAGALEGLILLVRYLFAHWPFRKIYVEAPEFNASQFASAIRMGVLKEEGRLVGHRYYNGRFWDYITWAIYPAEAEAFVASRPGLFVSDPTNPEQ